VCEPANRIVRARLFIALAMILSARSEGAQAMLALVESDQHAVSGRMRALRHAIAALWERYRGVRNGALMLDALDALEGQHLGGLGRLMRGFPLADNASLRLSDLSLPERRVLAKLGRRDAIVSEPQVKAVLAKLACVDVRAATRRLPSVRSANDGTLVHSSALPP
jgi:hypothetical protein